MKNTPSLILIAAAFSFTTSLTWSAEKCVFPPVQKLDRGSTISTFVYDFWDYTKKNLAKDFKKYPFIMQADGPSAGDYHFGNVGVYWNEKKNKTDLAIIDMDDSGPGNQFGDLIKMLLFIKSEYKEDGMSRLALKFYVQGLESKDGAMLPTLDPKDDQEKKLSERLDDLVKLLGKDKEFFDRENQDYVLRKIETNKKGELKFSKKFGLNAMGELSADRAFDENLGRAAVEKLGQILDSGFQINVSGSSIGAYRFVYLVKTNLQIKNKETKKTEPVFYIVELKQNNCAGVIKYQPKQANPTERFEDNKSNLQSTEFWTASESQIIQMESHSYLLRVKKAGPMEKVVEKIKKKSDVEAFTAFYAYTLGRIQSPTAKAAFVNGLSKNYNEKEFIKTLEKFVQSYDESLASRTKK